MEVRNDDILNLTLLQSISRKYEADYLEKDTNPNKDKYIAGMQTLFSTYGIIY